MSKTTKSKFQSGTKGYSFIAISDVHLGAKLFNLPELGEDLKEAFVEAVDIAIEKKVNYFIVVGDLFDHNKPTADLVKFVKDQTDKLKASMVTAIAIAGDHDKPINDTAWIELSGFKSPNVATNKFLGFDYTDNSMDNVQAIIDYPDKGDVEWIFLHGQVPELFAFCEEKKLLDLRKVDLINTYPNLKGVILGDIHKPSEGTIADPTMTRKEEPYIGYCGSLGVVRLDEVDSKIGILYYDGNKLSRLPFPAKRDFVRVDVKSLVSVGNLLGYYVDKYTDNKGKKPVILVEYNRESKPLLSKITKLYEVAIVKFVAGSGKKDAQADGEVINIRSELKADKRIESVLKGLGLDPDLHTLVLNLLTDTEPKRLLDEFKTKYYENPSSEPA